jgi:uncharacterized NAD(P)/FAD-binding protein YdhS
MVALHLLADPAGPDVLLFEKRTPFGRGAAYSTPNPAHRLNVRASNMSAFPDRPDHFVSWLAEFRKASPRGDLFASRGEYGQYLQQMLADEVRKAASRSRLHLIPDEVISAARVEGLWRVETAVGRAYQAEAVILALGAGPPVDPSGVTNDLQASPWYGANPWAWTPPDEPPGEGPFFIAGAGLTMVDVALTLAERFPQKTFLALSRRGLWPLEHAAGAAAIALEPPERGSPTAILRWLRAQSKQVDWRSAVDALRPATQTLWSSWSETEKARFLRHARAYWDIHRHRLAPDVAERIRDLQRSGRLALLRGRLVTADWTGQGVEVQWRPRGRAQVERLRACALVNCTGLSSPLARGDGLLADLRATGSVRSDRLGLGLDADASGRLIGEGGELVPGLFGLGPLIRGVLWEIIAVPDIRSQAPAVARAAAHYAVAARN